MIQGGEEYVYISYGITFAGMLLYGLSVFWRKKGANQDLEIIKKEEQS